MAATSPPPWSCKRLPPPNSKIPLARQLVKHQGDLIEARLAKYPQEQMLPRLVLLGKLTHYTKQLDMALFSDSIVEWYIKDFVQEHLGNN